MLFLTVFFLVWILSVELPVVTTTSVNSREVSALLSAINSPNLSSPFLTNQRSLPAVKVDPNGIVYTTQILKQQLANELNLPLRDLRVVDPSYPSQIQATFIARPKAILFTVENIKVVLKHDEALVFSPSQEEVQKFIPALQQQLSQANNLHDLSPSGSHTKPRFEHIVLETALNVACNSLFMRVRSIEPAIASALTDLRAESRGLDVLQTQVDELLPLKNQLDELRKHTREIKRAITEVLNSDEDMAMMFLSKHSSSPQTATPTSAIASSVIAADIDKIPLDQSLYSSSRAPTAEEISTGVPCATTKQPLPKIIDTNVETITLEMLFENYLNEIEWVASEVDDILDEVTNTEENVVLQLDLIRNRILKFELMLSVSSFVISCGALVTGLFGMNLVNHFEGNAVTFYVVAFAIGGGMLALFRTFIRHGRREKLF